MIAQLLHLFGIHDFYHERGGRRKCDICGLRQSRRPNDQWEDI